MKKKVYRDVAKNKKRISQACIALITLLFILTLRLSYIMIVKQAEYSAMAEEQWTSEVKIDAKRGRILDRNGVELAVSANVYRIDFDLNSIRDYFKKDSASYKNTKDLAAAVAPLVDMEAATVQKKLESKLPSGKDAGSATLIRRIEKDAADKVKALKVSGIIISPDTKRYYPNGEFLSHVLGSTNIDGQGLTGIELKYNDILSGTPGVKIAELDSTNRDLPYTISQYTEPIDGKDITLTIDENIQYFAESIATQAFNEQKAKAVSILVMDPKTGEILAMVNKPGYDPNNPYDGIENFEGATDGEKLQKMWRNRLVNDTFEPGSIFKVITAITAMENGVVSDSDTFVCNGGLKFGNRTIKCWKSGGHGTQTFGEIIQNSCNVGFMQLGEKIGKEKLTESIKKYGFGQISGVDLPGEARAIVKSVENISETDLATIAFGHTNTVNSVQYMAAFNTVANGGTWIQPHVMKEVTHEDSNGTKVIDNSFNAVTKNLASAENTAQLRRYLEKVVTNGSATSTFIEGYHIGGKTGTAKKISEDGRGYSSKYISSFVGMAPIEDPKVTIMITVDEPGAGAYYGSQVAAPYGKPLFTSIFNYMENKFENENKTALAKDIVIPEVRGMKFADAKKTLTEAGLECEFSEGNDGVVKTMKPYPGYTVKEGAKITLYSNNDGGSTTSIVMPDLNGYSEAAATELLKALGLKYSISGSGAVSSQSVPAGEVITNAITIKLELKKTVED